MAQEVGSALPNASPAVPSIEQSTAVDGAAVLHLLGDWSLLALRQSFDSLSEQAAALQHAGGQHWDLRALQRLDNAGALLLWRAWDQQLPPNCHCLPEHQVLFSKLTASGLAKAGVAPPAGMSALGRDLFGLADHLREATRLLGQLVLDAGQLIKYPGLMAWRDISAHIFRAGAQALTITALVGFLVGVTLSYLTARQLQAYGADIFVINILGISVWRELGPLLAAILVAGRSGSAMTAQLGVMRVTQELDALSVLGISHTIRLVTPKLLALAVAMPLISLWTSAMVLAGGMVAARATLGLEYVQFLQGLPAAVPQANLWLGLSKALVFGLLIAFVACHFGLRIKPNSESLGTGTTNSVVTSITVVIIADAIFAVLFSDLGI